MKTAIPVLALTLTCGLHYTQVMAKNPTTGQITIIIDEKAEKTCSKRLTLYSTQPEKCKIESAQGKWEGVAPTSGKWKKFGETKKIATFNVYKRTQPHEAHLCHYYVAEINLHLKKKSVAGDQVFCRVERQDSFLGVHGSRDACPCGEGEGGRRNESTFGGGKKL